MFKVESAQIECDECGRPTRHERNVRYPNHILHFLLTLFTAGLWVFVWLFVSTFPDKDRWCCSKCGEIPDVDEGFSRMVGLSLAIGIPLMLFLAYLVTR